MDEFLRFQPLPQERVWGGRALATALGRTLPPGDRPIGESWEIVDRPEAQSVVVGGVFDGLTLRQVIERHSAAVMGPRWPAGKPFPLLVKWLDCRERLSLQVHPPAAVAVALGGEPKTENWFVAAAEPGAHLIVGLKSGVTREKFEAAVAAGTVESCVNRFPVAAGDSVLVPSGTVHAIDGGNLILEIQQNSDTTYRVDDWGRVGLDGKPRQLHVAESLQSILWDAELPPVIKNKAPRGRKMFGQPVPEEPATLADTSEFRITRLHVAMGGRLDSHAGQQPLVLSVIEGRLASASEEVKRGDNVVLPFKGKFTFVAVEDSVVIITSGFAPVEGQLRYYRLFCRVLTMLLTVSKGDGPAGFDDRDVLRMSVVALGCSGVFAVWSYAGGSDDGAVFLIGFIGGFGGSPTCLLLSIWQMHRYRRTGKALLAAVIGAVGTLVSWGAVYLRVAGKF